MCCPVGHASSAVWCARRAFPGESEYGGRRPGHPGVSAGSRRAGEIWVRDCGLPRRGIDGPHVPAPRDPRTGVGRARCYFFCTVGEHWFCGQTINIATVFFFVRSIKKETKKNGKK